MYEAQVQRGAAWLDKRMGTDWPLLIDVSKLVMSECSSCIIGQVFNIERGDDFGRDSWLEFRAATDQIDVSAFGFNLPDDDATEDEHSDCDVWEEDDCPHWQGLRAAWETEIKRRLNEGVALAD